MTTVKDMLRDADPLRHGAASSDADRDRVRHAVLATTSDSPVPSSARPLLRTRFFGAVGFPALARFRAPVFLAAALAVVVVLMILGARIWSDGGTALQAAVRFEVRLAETQPAPDLQPARIAGSNRTIYLYRDVVVTNDDISDSRVVPGDTPSQFSVAVTFNAAGTEKMRKATAGHIGGPVAILIDGDVVMAPTLRSPIGDSAVISGDFTRREAERIANGMSLR